MVPDLHASTFGVAATGPPLPAVVVESVWAYQQANKADATIRPTRPTPGCSMYAVSRACSAEPIDAPL
jgi:hypothetical protein